MVVESGKGTVKVRDSVWSENVKREIAIDWWNRSRSALCWDTFLQFWHCHILPKCSAHCQARGGQKQKWWRVVFHGFFSWSRKNMGKRHLETSVFFHRFVFFKDLLWWILWTFMEMELDTRSQCKWWTCWSSNSNCSASRLHKHIEVPAICETHWLQDKSWTNHDISKSESLQGVQTGHVHKLSRQLLQVSSDQNPGY